MSRDYSSRRNGGSGSGKRGNPRRRPAARSTPQRRARGGGTPGWVWLLCGLCIGLTVAAGFYVFGRPAGDGAREQVAIDMPAPTDDEAGAQSAQAPDAEAADRKEEEPRFSFYKMLPNYEVVIPEEEYPESDSQAGVEPAPPPGTDEASLPAPTTPRIEEPGRYIIQAGSFSTHADADRRQAELALLGLSAQIVDVELASGKTVYRVQSDTIGSSDKLNELLARLRANRIDTLVMRARN